MQHVAGVAKADDVGKISLSSRPVRNHPKKKKKKEKKKGGTPEILWRPRPEEGKNEDREIRRWYSLEQDAGDVEVVGKFVGIWKKGRPCFSPPVSVLQSRE